MEEVKEIVDEVKEVVSMRQLLECGVHFGHQTKRWNPKMKKYIFTARNGIHVIDLQQSIQLIHVACEFVKEVMKGNGSVLFVGTKKQAQDAIKEESARCEMPFVNHRWLGGTLTNISTVRQSINKLKDFEKLQESGAFDLLSKKEQAKRLKAYTKLNHTLEGIKDMIKTPSVLFVVDTQKEQLAIKEAKKLNIPIIGVVDTNADPREIDYPIPANDDAIRAVKLICSVVSDAVIRGRAAALVSQKKVEIAKQEAATKRDSQAKEESSDSYSKQEKAKEEVSKEGSEKKVVKKEEKKEIKKEAKEGVEKEAAKKATEKKKPAAKKPAAKKSTAKTIEKTTEKKESASKTSTIKEKKAKAAPKAKKVDKKES